MDKTLNRRHIHYEEALYQVYAPLPFTLQYMPHP